MLRRLIDTRRSSSAVQLAASAMMAVTLWLAAATVAFPSGAAGAAAGAFGGMLAGFSFASALGVACAHGASAGREELAASMGWVRRGDLLRCAFTRFGDLLRCFFTRFGDFLRPLTFAGPAVGSGVQLGLCSEGEGWHRPLLRGALLARAVARAGRCSSSAVLSFCGLGRRGRDGDRWLRRGWVWGELGSCSTC